MDSKSIYSFILWKPQIDLKTPPKPKMHCNIKLLGGLKCQFASLLRMELHVDLDALTFLEIFNFSGLLGFFFSFFLWNGINKNFGLLYVPEGYSNNVNGYSESQMGLNQIKVLEAFWIWLLVNTKVKFWQRD